MDDAAQQRQAQLRGEKAKAILESPIWQEVWGEFEQFIWEQFQKTESRDPEMLLHWKRMHVAGLQLKAAFERALAEGKFAAADLEFKEKRSLIDRAKAKLKLA